MLWIRIPLDPLHFSQPDRDPFHEMDPETDLGSKKFAKIMENFLKNLPKSYISFKNIKLILMDINISWAKPVEPSWAEQVEPSWAKPVDSVKLEGPLSSSSATTPCYASDSQFSSTPVTYTLHYVSLREAAYLQRLQE